MLDLKWYSNICENFEYYTMDQKSFCGSLDHTWPIFCSIDELLSINS